MLPSLSGGERAIKMPTPRVEREKSASISAFADPLSLPCHTPTNAPSSGQRLFAQSSEILRLSLRRCLSSPPPNASPKLN